MKERTLPGRACPPQAGAAGCPKGYIHSLQSMGTLDGPGVRFVVFMQGCPLRCGYCHNPDTWNMADYKIVAAPEEIFEKISRYRNYFGEDGGVTVSGGEALLQSEFVAGLFALCRNAGIHTCLDTSGCIWNEKTEELLRVTDLVLLDVKMTSEEDYARYTKGSLMQTMFFLEQLEKLEIPTWIRHVVVPGFNDDEEDKKKLGDLLRGFTCIRRTDMLPFRKLCKEKYEKLGIEFPFDQYEEG